MKARWRSHSWVAWVRISTVPPECSLERFRVSFMLQHNAFWTGFYLVILFVTKLYYTLIWYNPKTNFIIKHKAPLKMISYFYSLAFKTSYTTSNLDAVAAFRKRLTGRRTAAARRRQTVAGSSLALAPLDLFLQVRLQLQDLSQNILQLRVLGRVQRVSLTRICWLKVLF